MTLVNWVLRYPLVTDPFPPTKAIAFVFVSFFVLSTWVTFGKALRMGAHCQGNWPEIRGLGLSAPPPLPTSGEEKWGGDWVQLPLSSDLASYAYVLHKTPKRTGFAELPGRRMPWRYWENGTVGEAMEAQSLFPRILPDASSPPELFCPRFLSDNK